MAAPLYQQIMNVPGLSGTWQQRLAQYYKALTGQNYNGSLQHGLYMLDQIKKGNYPQVQQAQQASPQQPAESLGTTLGRQAGQMDKARPFNEILNEKDFIPVDLYEAGAKRVVGDYFNPLVQKSQEQLETNFANRGLTRSGIRNRAVNDLYRDYADQHATMIVDDVNKAKSVGTQEYNMYRDLYEKSGDKANWRPSTTQYQPYNLDKNYTPLNAGRYGRRYSDWLNSGNKLDNLIFK